MLVRVTFFCDVEKTIGVKHPNVVDEMTKFGKDLTKRKEKERGISKRCFLFFYYFFFVAMSYYCVDFKSIYVYLSITNKKTKSHMRWSPSMSETSRNLKFEIRNKKRKKKQEGILPPFLDLLIIITASMNPKLIYIYRMNTPFPAHEISRGEYRHVYF